MCSDSSISPLVLILIQFLHIPLHHAFASGMGVCLLRLRRIYNNFIRGKNYLRYSFEGIGSKHKSLGEVVSPFLQRREDTLGFSSMLLCLEEAMSPHALDQNHI